MPYGFTVPPRWGYALTPRCALALLLACRAVPAQAQALPPDTLTFTDALRRAEASSPALRAAGLEADAREALVGQADRLPNPALDLEAENLGAAGEEATQATIALAQTVELGGDRAARRALARAEADLAVADLAVASLGVAAGVRAGYAEAAAAQEAARLAAEAVALADTARAVTAEQVDAGDRSPVDLTRAEVAVAEAAAEAARAEAARRAAFAALAALWRAAPDFGAVAPFDATPTVPPYEDLAALLAASPTLARFAAEAARREAVVQLEHARRVPDPTISAGYRQFFDPGAGALVVGLALPLPLFDRNTGAVAAARARLTAVEAERAAFVVEAQTALAAAYGDLAAAAAEMEVLRQEALPRAEDVAARIDEGYRAGKFTLLDVLDARRTLVALRTRSADALAAYYHAAADVARLLGLADLTRLTPAPSPDLP
jgi:cobalt-zinc-cadmium efflux system outer membrane protein